ncbi:TVG0303941 [Thermoplasma volcanium GSS1]|uniref:TVG0303941 protein n=1 Tax=Thermoplasma volcanium (strain ATCC 51530 / DSM 4299 / JCM 9571 / NBRC 15438 / GSS1) TaxID=273116 RepID=Q97C12_THEVO|nr:hypothetical protein [Thermoplasma volcanium]BAB59435.1 TVG0303941 [Thermoplasma volcanium GSS1]
MIYDFGEDGYKITLFGGIKGLVRDGEELKRDLYEVRPEIIYIVLTQEQIDGLNNFLKDPFELSLSDYEIIYGLHLSAYGEVMTPPPIYIEAIKYANETGTTLVPLDVPEKEYSDYYSKNVGFLDLLRNSLRKKRIMKMEFGDKTPEDFVEKWDAVMHKVKGIERVDTFRFNYVRDNLKRNLEKDKGKSVFVITEYEFYKNLENFIKEL